MKDSFHDKRYPGESDRYRTARNELLAAELDLIRQVEQVAALRRGLPPGGDLREDYVFEEGPADLRDTQTVIRTKLSELFSPGKDCLVLINTMFAPGDELPCPACNSLADGYNASAQHVSDRVDFALVTRAPLKKLRAWAAARNWRDIRLLSSYNNDFNTDYHAELGDDAQVPSITVFTRDDGGVIRHFYSVEAHWVAVEGRDPRHLDLFWPLWQLLDLTPEGRGTDWYPRYSYGEESGGCCS
jgi:predicted dithiol-disulfide oxidoreductase (DUF899 family)